MSLTVKKIENQFAEIFGEPISTYTRAQAIDDGVLVDVTPIAKEAGFKYPVAVTGRVFHEVIVPPDGVSHCQDDIGRLWDILNVLRVACKRSPGSLVNFTIGIQNKPGQIRPCPLKSICGPGDNAEPVITIMLPDED